MGAFSMQHEINGNAMVLSISGRVDSTTATTMDAELDKLIDANKWVVLDLKEVEFLSSAGLRAIVAGLKAARKSNHKIKLASIPDHIAEVMETMGLIQLMQVYPSVAEAIISF